MPGGNAHIAHDKFRPAKHLCVDALQDKVFFLSLSSVTKKVLLILPFPNPDINDPAGLNCSAATEILSKVFLCIKFREV
jgi:hypothetical protein